MMRIIGIYPVKAPEPCYLVEVEFDRSSPNYNWHGVTQVWAGEPRGNWQATYAEQPLDLEGKRWVFFFHYLDFERRLLTPDGAIELPEPKEMPEHLKDIKYEKP